MVNTDTVMVALAVANVGDERRGPEAAVGGVMAG